MNRFTSSILRSLIIVIPVCFFVVSCSTSSTPPDPQVLIDADLAFSKMSEEQGSSAAFIHYADSAVVLFRNGTRPVQGHQDLTTFYNSISTDNVTLTWEPENAEIAASGDLGYTWGNYYLGVADSLGNMNYQQGNYVSIWKKQADGDWKFVLDGGTVPQPTTRRP